MRNELSTAFSKNERGNEGFLMRYNPLIGQILSVTGYFASSIGNTC